MCLLADVRDDEAISDGDYVTEATMVRLVGAAELIHELEGGAEVCARILRESRIIGHRCIHDVHEEDDLPAVVGGAHAAHTLGYRRD